MCKCGNSNSDRCDLSHSRPRECKGKGKTIYEVTEDQNSNAMDDMADQVQSLFYHDVHFNAVNTQMHTEIDCKTPAGEVLKQNSKWTPVQMEI